MYVTMNILESQVADINYLVDSPITPISPIAIPRSMNGHRQSSSAESPAETGNNGGGNKRKLDEASSGANGNTHTRAKRNRYISIAWYVQLFGLWWEGDSKLCRIASIKETRQWEWN